MKILLALMILVCCPTLAGAGGLEAILASQHRSDGNSARDSFRHPVETLTFFQVEPDMTVVEIWPGGGWYTEILAPYLRDGGKLYAAHFPDPSSVDYFNRVRADFLAMLESNPDVYSAVDVVEFDPAKGVLEVPDGVADRVLTFRNVHNWLRNDAETAAFELFYEVLKPGGLLGVVEHRADKRRGRDWLLEAGYMTETAVIELAEKAGFELVARSEINANPRDNADHPRGVWTLPPSLRLGDVDRDKYLAIGESDRMTLLFAKPE